MAKKKTSRRPRSRRRMSGVGSTKVMNLLEMAGGTILGGMAGRMIGSSLGQGKDPKLVGAATAVAGYFIAAKSSGPIIQGVGVGMIASGAMDVAHSMGIIKGPGESDVYVLPAAAAGIDDEMGADEYMAGDESSYVSGDDGYDMGYVGNAPIG